jgi:hypothetical protein
MALAPKPLRLDAFLRPAELAARRPGTLETGLPALDGILGGGFPEGRLCELMGARGGRTAIALHAAARLTASGRLVALVDGSGALEPRSAAGLGVDLRRLLWVRLPPARLAGACDAILRGGAFALVIFDLVSVRRSPDPSSWVRLGRAAEASRTSLLILGADPSQGPGFSAAVSLALHQARACYVGRGPGRLLQSFTAEAELVHNKLGLPPATAKLQWRAPDPFAPSADR